ncbi:MAG: hypothetical protein R3257_06140 [bacterium]|nr:hypothetical protein [bacterium]
MSQFRTALAKPTNPNLPPLIRDLALSLAQMLKGEIQPEEFQEKTYRLFIHHGLKVSPQEAQKFTQRLLQASLDTLKAKIKSSEASGVDAQDPASLSTSPHMGLKAMTAGALILGTSKVWVPAVAKAGGYAATLCLANPLVCHGVIIGMVQGSIDGLNPESRGLPQGDPLGILLRKSVEYSVNSGK